MANTEYLADENEIVARFTNSSHCISKSNRKLKYNAFMDNRYPRDLSVFRVTDLLANNDEAAIWEIANEHVFKTATSQVKGRADLQVNKIREIKDTQNALDVFIDNTPVRHGNIRYTPSNREIEMTTAQQLQSIALKHTLI